MKTEVFISLYLDTRRKKANNKYPVKLRVFTTEPRKQMLYPTVFDFTIAEFDTVWLKPKKKPQEEEKNLAKKLRAVVKKADDVIDELEIFSFEQFERKLYLKAGEGENVFYHYELMIQNLKANNQIGTASNYQLSLKSLKEFIITENSKHPDKLNFSKITPKWLQQYENFMTDSPRERSLTTVSMYLRALRTIFNNAISENEIKQDIYPFGKKKYQMPSVRNVKKALSNDELKLLFTAKALTKEQEKAKDFWFFSYACNGINIKDIALLKYSDINGDSISFYRAKTIKTSKTNLKPVIIYLTDFNRSIIEKYSNKDTKSQNYIFPIISNKNTELENFKLIKNFTKFINQNLKKLAKEIGITSDISTYWARHSFATNAIRKGASMEFVSEALSHSNLLITQGYFSGFEDDVKKELSNKLMDF